MISLIRHIFYYSHLLINSISLNLIISARDDNILWPYWTALWFSFFLYPSYSIWYKYIIFLIYHTLNLVKFMYNDKIFVFKLKRWDFDLFIYILFFLPNLWFNLFIYTLSDWPIHSIFYQFILLVLIYLFIDFLWSFIC